MKNLETVRAELIESMIAAGYTQEQVAVCLAEFDRGAGLDK